MRMYMAMCERIEPVEVERYTDTSVWIDGRRNAKLSDWKAYFPTWKEAHDHLLAKATNEVNAQLDRLEYKKRTLDSIAAIKPPTDESQTEGN